MEEILQKAREIGLLIKESDVYTQYQDAELNLGRNNDSRDMFDRYCSLNSEIIRRRNAGDIIENFESNELEELRTSVSENQVIMEFLQAEQLYADLLMLIQKQLRDAE